jgi:hypothetical protein
VKEMKASGLSFSDREVAVDLGPDYDMAEENSLESTQVTGCQLL